MNFSYRLRAAIKQSGLRVKELAALAEVNARTIENWLESKPSLPRVDLAVRVARALNTSVEFLVFGPPSSKHDDYDLENSDSEKITSCFSEYNEFNLSLKNLTKQELEILKELIIIKSASCNVEPENPGEKIVHSKTKESRPDASDHN